MLSRVLGLIISLSLFWGAIQFFETGLFTAGVTGVLLIIMGIFVLYIAFGEHTVEQIDISDWDD